MKAIIRRKLRNAQFLTSLLPKDPRKRRKALVFLTYFSSLALTAIVVGVFVVFVTLIAFSRNLPNPNALLERSAELSTKITDRNGESIYEVYGEKHRVLVQLDQISPDLMNATLAVEDSNFYSHQGVSLRGMVRATLNTFTGQGLQGGSTLTQQVVKNALLSQERTVTRKLKELILAWQLENRYSKDEILQMYLNESPYGGQNYGVFTAARAYFNKAPNELTVAESAYIAGLPQSPSRYSPFSADQSVGLERKNYVLYLMNVRGWLDKEGNRHYLSDEDYQAALDEEMEFEAAPGSFKAPHFVFYVIEELRKMYGEEVMEQMGLEVRTSLDLEFQEAAEQIVKEEVDGAAGLNVGNGSLVALDPQTGQIIAMVGSKDYFAEPAPEGCTPGITGEGSCVFDPNVNVTLASRQPGSSIKPITYATLFSQGYTASTPILDVPTVFRGADGGKDYNPANYDGLFRGPMSARKSLANSLNIPAVKVVSVVGVESMMKQAQKMGITTLTDTKRFGPAITLGGGETKLLEMTGAFGVFASGGLYREPTPFFEIKDPHGKVLYEYRDSGGQRALSEGVAFLISDILSDDGARSEVFGFGSLLNISGQQVSVKTGTTDDKRDNYAIGFTKEIVIGTWVGNSNNDEMANVASGISGATPIWRRAMLDFIKDKEPNRFDPPEGLKKVTIDELTGMLPYEDFKTRAEWFVLGTEPTSVSDWYKRLEICEIDGRLANDECKDADETDTEVYIDIQALKPDWQMDADAWISENYSGESQYFPPRMTSDLEFDGDDVEKDRDPKVAIVNFRDGDRAPLGFRLKVEVSSANDIDRVEIFLDGNKVTDDESDPYGYNFEFTPAQSGETHVFRAKAVDEDNRDDDTEVTLRVGF